MSAIATTLLCTGAAAQTYRANLGPMQGLRTMLQDVHRAEPGQALYVALPKKR